MDEAEAGESPGREYLTNSDIKHSHLSCTVLLINSVQLSRLIWTRLIIDQRQNRYFEFGGQIEISTHDPMVLVFSH